MLKLLLLAISWQGVEARPSELLPGMDFSGVLTESDPPVHTSDLDLDYRPDLIHSTRIALRVVEPGTHFLRLRAAAFDSYLVLRDADGTVLAENDDLVGLDAELEYEFRPGVPYFVEVCALEQGSGAFVLHFRQGPLPVLGPAEVQARLFEDARARLSWAEAHYGPGHLQLASRLERLAGLHLGADSVVEARPLLERALGLREESQPESSYRLGLCRYNLARCLVRLGELANGRDLFVRAVHSFTLSRGADDSWTALCMCALADANGQLGDFNAAIELYNRALPIVESSFDLDPLDVATNLNNFGMLLISVREYAASRDKLQRCLNLERQFLDDDDLRIASTINNLATLFHRQALFDQARAHYLQALEIRLRVLGEAHPDSGQSYANLAILDQETGRSEAARSGFSQALSIFGRAYGPDDYRTADALNGLAELDLGSGHLADALAAYQECLRIRRRALGPEHPRSIGSLRGIAAVFRAQGQLREALTLLDEAIALETGQQVREAVGLPSMLLERAFLLADLGDHRLAWNEVVAALHHQRQRLLRGLAGLSEAERLQTLAAMKGSLELMCSLAAQIDAIEVHRTTLEKVLEWKGLSSRLLVSSKRSLLANLGPLRGRTLAQLQGIQSMISSRVFGPPSSDPLRDQRELQRLRERRNQLELELQAQAPVVAVPAALEMDQVISAVPKQAALLAFLVHRSYRSNRSGAGGWGEEQLTAWICDRDSVKQVSLGPAAPLREAIRDLIAQLVAFRSGGRSLAERRAPPNQVLWQRLWTPLEPSLRSFSTVLVSPDSFLAGLPFEVLESKDHSFLIESHRFLYLQDAAALAQRSGEEDSTRPDPSLLVIGAVDYDAREALEAEPPEANAAASSHLDYRGTWYPLGSTGYEADSILYLHRRELGDQVPRLLLKGAEASEGRLKTELPAYRYVHLATHGFFQPQDMPSMWESAQTADPAAAERKRLTGLHPGLLAGLVCAGGNLRVPGSREDGFLTAEEVAWLDLRAAELVVLSACKTGIGDTRAAEGMMSLRRAFHLAGAENVVSSLWDVDDNYAPKLMQSLYSKLWTSGLPVAEALHQAQLEMLRDNRNRNAEKDGLPSTWGAFVLSGSGG